MTNKVTHNGKQYEIGKPYWFHNGAESIGSLRTLKKVNPETQVPFLCKYSCFWTHCEIFNPNDLGKITDAPIELEDGTVYQFDYDPYQGCYGRYDSSRNIFIGGMNTHRVNACTNIVKLVPEAK